MRAMRYLLDTNVISEPTRPNPSQLLLDRLAQAFDESAMCAVSLHELRYGIERLPSGKKRNEIEAYIMGIISIKIPTLPYDTEAARWHAIQRARLIARGRTPTSADGQIAAIAATNNLILVTRNTKDFEGYEGLKLQNWWEMDAAQHF